MARPFFGGSVTALLLVASQARAGEPLASLDPEAPPEERWEPGVLPVLSYDSDLGFGFGAIGVLARFEPGYDPYRLRLQAAVQATVAVDDAADERFPYHDDYVRMDMPGLIGDRLRLQAEIAFNKLATTGYYGFGQRSLSIDFPDDVLDDSETARRFYQYDKTALSLDLFARFTPFKIEKPGEDPRLELYDGTHAAYYWIDRYPGSKLQADVRHRFEESAPGRALRELLHGASDHPRIAKSFGILWDDRDHEFAPDSGSSTELGVRLSPGVTDSLSYSRLHLGTRWFAPILRNHLVFAHRAAFDVLPGHPPVDEMSQIGVLFPEDFGGSTTLRGVPLRRFHGRMKLLGQVEVRGSFPWFEILEQRFQIGLVGFVDAGHVWADFEDQPSLDLDFERPPFTLGTGGGLRIRWADTFILRIDGAYSPTERTPGVYLDIGHAF